MGCKYSYSIRIQAINPCFFFLVFQAHSQLIGSLNLNHTLSNPLPPPGYNRQRPHVFAIQQSDGGVYLFQTASADQLREWVSTCNYWAGRKSKEPLPGGVSNMEYGWGDCLADVVMNLDAHYSGKYSGSSFTKDPDSVFINNWIPPSATMVSSTMNEKEQHIQLQKHLNNLNSEINHHRDVKGKMLIKVTRIKREKKICKGFILS